MSFNQEGALFYKDLNSLSKSKPVKLKDLFSIDPFNLKETIAEIEISAFCLIKKRNKQKSQFK